MVIYNYGIYANKRVVSFQRPCIEKDERRELHVIQFVQ